MKQVVVVLSLLLIMTATANAGPPIITDDAGTVDVGRMEIELTGSHIYDRERSNGISARRDAVTGEARLTTGLCKNLGISLALLYTFSDRTTEDGNLTGRADGFGDMVVELKYAFAELAGIAFAVKPSVIMPTGNYNAGLSDIRWQLGGALIATREFDEGAYAMHANLGYDHHDYRTEQTRVSNHNNLWFGSLAGEAKVSKDLTAVTEFGLSKTQDKTTNKLTGFAQVGARYELNKHLDINAGLKLGLTKPEDDLTIRYGLVLKF